MQVRRQGDARQVPRNDYGLVSGNGGILYFHSTLILSRHPSGRPHRSIVGDRPGGARNCIIMLAELGRPRRWRFVCGSAC